MTDREALAAALDRPDKVSATDREYAWVRHAVIDAARERLAQLEGDSETEWWCHRLASQLPTLACGPDRIGTPQGHETCGWKLMLPGVDPR